MGLAITKQLIDLMGGIVDIQKSMDAGMNAHLTKPLREKEIVKALTRFVK